MGVWSEWEDPVELRMRLDVAMVEIAELTEENRRLRQQLGLHDQLPARNKPTVADDQPRERAARSRVRVAATAGAWTWG